MCGSGSNHHALVYSVSEGDIGQLLGVFQPREVRLPAAAEKGPTQNAWRPARGGGGACLAPAPGKKKLQRAANSQKLEPGVFGSEDQTALPQAAGLGGACGQGDRAL